VLGLAAGFGNVWVPVCGDRPGAENGARPALTRVDIKTNQVTASIPVGPANSEGGLVASPEAVWMVTDPKGTLSRVDPATNKVAAEIAVAPGSVACVYADGAVWVSSPEKSVIRRVDAKTNSTGTGGELAFGDGHVWATVFQIPLSKVDPATNQVVKQWVGAGGDSVRVGHASLWLSNLREQNVWRIDLTPL
jgi:streptogramin lyase